MGTSHGTPRVPRFWITLLLGCVMVLGSVLFASTAWADGDGETTEGYLLVQQALGHLANDTTDYGIALAMEKIDDALNTADQEGVDVAELEQARAALEAGQVQEGRDLLQQSISAAISQLARPTGEDTGTTVVLNPLPGRGSLNGGDWGFLLVSVVLLVLGVGLAWRFRPEDNVRELRRRLGLAARIQATAHPDPPSEDAS